MGLRKRGHFWQYDFQYKLKRYQGSTGTDDRAQAELVEQEIKEKARNQKPRPRGYKWYGPVTYKGYHKRVSRKRGTPKHCEHCGNSDPAKRYDWASISHKYEDVNDYIRLCRACHLRMDLGKVTSADLAVIRELYDAGKSKASIARSFHVSSRLISHLLGRSAA